MKKYTRTLAVLMVVCLLTTIIGCSQKEEESSTKNVILMISDGTSVAVPTLSRWLKAYDGTGRFDTNVRLNVDPYVSGLIRTYWKNTDGSLGAITDSAPSGTAYATGYKAHDQYIGIGSDNKAHATLLELAESLGKSTGLVATANMQHATPATFAAHTKARKDYEDIAEQMLESGVDVVLGGGSKYMKNREDGKDLIKELKSMGYGYLTTAGEMAKFDKEQVYGMFAPDFMAYDIDRKLLAPEEPSLKEMTEKAISMLNKNERGFFLMVEGSKVDWGAHNNDPVAVTSEFLAFDAAVGVAIEYAKSRDDTMVLVVEDHGTGGISIGSTESDTTYSSYPLIDVINPISRAKITGNGALELLAQGKSAEEILALLGIKEPTLEEVNWLSTLEPDLGEALSVSRQKLGNMISSRCNIGWTTVGHTGEDVVLYSYLPGDKRLTGLLENTEITKAIEDAWGAKLTDSVCMHK